jgi:TonB family protein
MSAPLLLTWLAGTLLPLGALWLVYRLALRGERCFGYNRAFLLLAPVLAAGLPLLPRPAMPLWLNGPAVAVAAGNTGVSVLLPTVELGQGSAAATEWSVGTWLIVIYVAGVAFCLGRLAWQAARLWALGRRWPREVRPGYVLAYTGGLLPTSSFGRVVFWDETVGLPLAEAAAVLAHEVAHVQQRHTLDVLWLEAWRAVLWLNPFAHLLLPGLRLTHELLADEAAAPETGATAYPTLLARLAAQQFNRVAYSALLQPFTFSFTLTRIAMLQNQNPVRRWKQWLVLPALGGLFLAACQNKKTDSMRPMIDKEARTATVIANFKEAIRQDSLHGGKGWKDESSVINIDKEGKVTITHRGNVPSPPIPMSEARAKSELDAANHVYTYAEQMPQLPSGGGVSGIVKQIQDNFVYPTGPHQEGRVFASFTVRADGSVGDTKIVKGLAPAYDAAVLAAIQKLPRFVPGKQSGRDVAVSFTVPMLFKEKL